MLTPPIRHALEKERAITVPTPFDSLLGCVVDGEYIVAIHLLARHGIRTNTLVYLYTDGLTHLQSCMCGVKIVLANKKNRDLLHCREIQTLVEDAFLYGPVPEEAHRHPRRALHREGPC